MALGFLSRLKEGLAKTASKLTTGIGTVFVRKRRLDDEALDELEDTLIAADLGQATAARLVASLRRTRFGRDVTDEEVRDALAQEIEVILEQVAFPLAIDPDARPHVVLVVGVNGVGKTTTIAKLASMFAEAGLSSVLVAGDTFRAAAVEQLRIWGERIGVPVVSGAANADPAGLAFDAYAKARAEGADILLIDTAGRLHNKQALMDELAKVVRVLKKQDPSSPHTTLLVLDATTGQNAIAQVRTFRDLVAVNGLVVTKLDGTAKGGVVVSLADQFQLPVHAVGVGETADDLRPFEARAFARGLVGLPAD